MRRLGRVAVALAAVALLGGCAHTSALLPVSPDERTKVRFAAIDVLANEGIDVKRAPACRLAAQNDISCSGLTADGQAIRVLSPGDDPAKITVTVGDATVYDGPLAEILERAAEGR